jgi:hypothetical protein
LSGLFSNSGAVSKRYFLVCTILHAAAKPVGMGLFACVWLVSRPNEHSSVLGEESASWVGDHLGWLTHGWYQLVLPIGLYLIAYRIFACAYVKRARALGIEITTGEVYYCFMGLERGATMADLLSSKSKQSIARRVSSSTQLGDGISDSLVMKGERVGERPVKSRSNLYWWLILGAVLVLSLIKYLLDLYIHHSIGVQ